MAAINVEVHVVSKIDNERHAAFAVQEDSSHAVELPPSSIRARTVCVSLTSNNLSYARGGHFMHWFVVQCFSALQNAVFALVL